MRAIILCAALAASGAAALAQDVALKEQNGLRYACGGVGVEGREALAALRPQANVEFLFVSARRGGYLADVAVTVYAGDKAVLQVNAEGPMCELAAPPARYRIEAVHGGVKRSQEVSAGAKTARIVFRFPDEPWDGVRASEEEKAQARGASR